MSSLIMMVRNCLCHSTQRFWNGQTKRRRFYLLPNFHRVLNFTIFMGPIFRPLIAFGNVSINSLGHTTVALRMRINCDGIGLVLSHRYLVFLLIYVTLALHDNYSAAMEMQTSLFQICMSYVIYRYICNFFNFANIHLYLLVHLIYRKVAKAIWFSGHVIDSPNFHYNFLSILPLEKVWPICICYLALILEFLISLKICVYINAMSKF